MEDIMKIVQFLNDSGFWLKVLLKQLKMKKKKKQRDGFLSGWNHLVQVYKDIC